MNLLKVLLVLLMSALPYAGIAAERSSYAAHNHLQTLLLAQPSAEQECDHGKPTLSGCMPRSHALSQYYMR